MKVISNHESTIAYGDPADTTSVAAIRAAAGRDLPPVIVRRGVNDLSADQLAVVKADPHAIEHAAAGLLVFETDAPVPVVEAAPVVEDETPLTDEQITEQRVQKPGEKKTAYTARMTALDVRIEKERAAAPPTTALLTAEQVAFLDQHFALSAENQAAMLPAMTDDEKALVAADSRSKPAAP